MAANHESRLVVAFSAEDLKRNRHDAWYVRNRISRQLFTRDMFDYRLPLEKDTYFFGREALILDYLDAARRGENRGIFGLRKTGKTSFLFKLRRTLDDQNILTFYYDCKSPSVRQLKWHELLISIGRRIALKFGRRFNPPSDTRRFATAFTKLLESIPTGTRVALIFDEIEYISPFSQQDLHWHTEYIPFWQTIWAAQSQHRNLFVVLAGVNPSIVEIDKIDQIQNPLFGIVSYRYLTGLGVDEIRTMLRVLGRRMGMRFSSAAIEYIHSRYGGHPLLTRLACSDIHQQHYLMQAERPIEIDDRQLLKDENQRDSALVFYCRHVVSELQDFYPDEYDVLEYLASGQVQAFLEFATYPEFVSHLQSYGLISEDTSRNPTIAIPVVGRYVALEEARRNGRKTILEVVVPMDRSQWFRRRIHQILSDIRELERLAVANGRDYLYGPNSVPDSHRLVDSVPVDDQDQFDNFVNAANICLVEGVEAYGNHIGHRNFFWQYVRHEFPQLFDALHRIRVYRNRSFHASLTQEVRKSYEAFLNKDLEGRDPGAVDDLWFVLQQCILDGLHSSLQFEISRLGS